MTGSLSRLRGRVRVGESCNLSGVCKFQIAKPFRSPTLTLPRKREREPVISCLLIFSPCYKPKSRRMAAI